MLKRRNFFARLSALALAPFAFVRGADAGVDRPPLTLAQAEAELAQAEAEFWAASDRLSAARDREWEKRRPYLTPEEIRFHDAMIRCRKAPRGSKESLEATLDYLDLLGYPRATRV